MSAKITALAAADPGWYAQRKRIACFAVIESDDGKQRVTALVDDGGTLKLVEAAKLAHYHDLKKAKKPG